MGWRMDSQYRRNSHEQQHVALAVRGAPVFHRDAAGQATLHLGEPLLSCSSLPYRRSSRWLGYRWEDPLTCRQVMVRCQCFDAYREGGANSPRSFGTKTLKLSDALAFIAPFFMRFYLQLLSSEQNRQLQQEMSVQNKLSKQAQ